MFKVIVNCRRGIGSDANDIKTWLPAEKKVHLFKDFNRAKDFTRSVIELTDDIAKKLGKTTEYHIADDTAWLKMFGLDQDKSGPFLDYTQIKIVAL